MRMELLSVCSFTALPDLGNVTTYRQLKALVLKAGRFSIFEATETQRIARLFVKLDKDPDVVLDISCGYPWTKVTRKSEKSHDTISERKHKTLKK